MILPLLPRGVGWCSLLLMRWSLSSCSQCCSLGAFPFSPWAARVASATGPELWKRSCRLRPLSRGSRPATGMGSSNSCVGAPGARVQRRLVSSAARRPANRSPATRLPGPDATTSVVSGIRLGKGRKGAWVWPGPVACESEVLPESSCRVTGAFPSGAASTASHRVELGLPSASPAYTWWLNRSKRPLSTTGTDAAFPSGKVEIRMPSSSISSGLLSFTINTLSRPPGRGRTLC